MAPVTSQYKISTVYSAAAQDAFDVKLNQTIFAAAFGLGGVVLLGMVAYLSYWIVCRCTKRRMGSHDPGSPQLAPKALLLPGQLAAKDEKTLRSLSPPPSLDEVSVAGSESGKQLDGTYRRWFWFSRMRYRNEAIPNSPASRRSSDEPPSLPPLAHLRPLNARTRFDDPSVPDPAISSSPSRPCRHQDANASQSSSVPRIIVEDLDPGSGPEPYYRDSLSSASDSCSDMSLDEKEQSDELLVVPPMSWNAPRELMDSESSDTLPETIAEDEPPSGSKSKPKSRIISVLLDISHVVRLHPKNPVTNSKLNKANATIAPPPTSHSP